MSHTLAELESLLGGDTARSMASIFAAEWRRQCAVIADPMLPTDAGTRSTKRQAAHDLVTNAGSLGFNELSTAARRLEQAILKGDALETANAAAPIPALAEAAVNQLVQRYPSL
jgi:HPt (histidine-containing phosphotransfer) domain-containing protein